MKQVRKGFPTLPLAASLSLVTAVVAQVTVTDNVSDAQEPNCIKIATPACTLYYDKDGAGFTSIVDTDGNDWISYKPGGGSAGEYRGIPNMGPCCHPGYSGHHTEITRESAEQATITSSKNGWVTRWDFFPTHATLTIEEKPDDEYYWLYEGTPGGGVDDGDYMVLADGTRKPINTNEWRNDLSPEWIYFGDGAMNRVLFYVNHQDDNVEDQYWLMNNKMTVFGFGRTCHGAC